MLADWINAGQREFGLQPAVSGFESEEFHLIFASGDDADTRWRFACMLRKSRANTATGSASTIQQDCVGSLAASACYNLAMLIMTTKPMQDLLTQTPRIPALRLDCGFYPETQKAFLNELAASPGGRLFSGAHQLDILTLVVKNLVEQMKLSLR